MAGGEESDAGAETIDVGFRRLVMTRTKSGINGDSPRAVLPEGVTEAATGATNNDPLGEPLGIREVATLIGCSPWTVRQVLIPSGLPCFRSGPSGRLIFYRLQVIRWILRRQRAQGGHL
jgi:hypothetical protein